MFVCVCLCLLCLLCLFVVGGSTEKYSSVVGPHLRVSKVFVVVIVVFGSDVLGFFE